jgi:biopolymer transport protein ExbB
MIHTLAVMTQKESLVRPGDLAGGIRQALLSTAAGLLVAILSYAAYNFLVTRIEAILVDLERAANEILAFLGGADVKEGD